MQNPEICRSQAMKCMLLAGEAGDVPYKFMLLSIAQLWRTIADTTEEMEALCGSPESRAVPAKAA